jgi:hypothetical protein
MDYLAPRSMLLNSQTRPQGTNAFLDTEPFAPLPVSYRVNGPAGGLERVEGGIVGGRGAIIMTMSGNVNRPPAPQNSNLLLHSPRLSKPVNW